MTTTTTTCQSAYSPDDPVHTGPLPDQTTYQSAYSPDDPVHTGPLPDLPPIGSERERRRVDEVVPWRPGVWRECSSSDIIRLTAYSPPETWSTRGRTRTSRRSETDASASAGPARSNGGTPATGVSVSATVSSHHAADMGVLVCPRGECRYHNFARRIFCGRSVPRSPSPCHSLTSAQLWALQAEAVRRWSMVHLPRGRRWGRSGFCCVLLFWLEINSMHLMHAAQVPRLGG